MPVDAVKAEGAARFAHHITLEGLRILRHGANQGVVGISTKCPAWGWIIRRNVIERAGTGMYLGDSDGTAPFFDGLIEHNLIFDTIGYNLQIKHQRARAVNPDDLSTPLTTIIRHNVFSKYGNGATGHQARPRPNLLVGHFPLHGAGANDRYAIYGNFFYANPTEALFQAEGNVALYVNLFVNPVGDAIHIQPHNDVPKNIWLFHNTVVASGTGMELRGATNDYLRILTANAVFAARPGVPGPETGNQVGELAQATAYLWHPLAPPGRLNLKPKSSKVWDRKGDLLLSENFPHATEDFDGLVYLAQNMGAYTASATPPRWWPDLSLKP